MKRCSFSFRKNILGWKYALKKTHFDKNHNLTDPKTSYHLKLYEVGAEEIKYNNKNVTE